MSRVPLIRVTAMPADTNPYGGVFGGWLMSQNAKFRTQQPIGPFVGDFVCQEHRLVIKADGGQHAESESDAPRTAFLNSRGYRVIRFWNHDVLNHPAQVFDAIFAALAAPHPSAASRLPPSPARGEGLGDTHA